MTANRIIHHIFNQPDIRHVDQAALEQLVETYPYFAAARLLLAQKQFIQRPDLTAPTLKKAQLYSSNPQHLHQLLTETAYVEEAPVVAAVVAEQRVNITAAPIEIEELEDEQILDEVEVAPDPVEAVVSIEETTIEAATPLDIEELEDEIAAEDQQILDEVEVASIEEPVNVTAAPVDTEEPEDEDQEILDEVEVAPVEAVVTVEEPAIEASAPLDIEELEDEVEVAPAPVEAVVTVEEPAIEASAPLDIEELEDEISAEDQQILDEIEAEDRANAALAAQQAQALTPQEEVAPVVVEEIAAATAQFEEITVQAPLPLTEKQPVTPEEPDEIIAIDYESIKETAAFETEKASDAPDEIVALDYESIKETAAFEAEKASDTPDEIIALDYDAMKEEEAFKNQIAVEAPDEIVAIDYEALKETAAFEAEKASDAPDEVVAIDYEALREEKPHYEPEIEEEEIVIAAAAEPAQTAGLAIPAASVITEKEEVADDEELEEGPIRIHPIDTPEEETVLTFQPLYTEDYFAYKKLKDPNTAEMMNDKAQAEMRSFTDWLRELKDNFVAGKTTKDWYHSQMHRLYEDDEPEVSERVEKMAMESIMLNDDIVSETLAEIWVRQHQHAKAIVIYQKLSLLNPDKNAYFAQKIKELQLLTDNNK